MVATRNTDRGTVVRSTEVFPRRASARTSPASSSQAATGASTGSPEAITQLSTGKPSNVRAHSRTSRVASAIARLVDNLPLETDSNRPLARLRRRLRAARLPPARLLRARLALLRPMDPDRPSTVRTRLLGLHRLADDDPGQCGGQGYSGPTTCAQGTCKVSNQWYSQCLP